MFFSLIHWDNTLTFFPGHPDEFLYLSQGENPYIDGVDDSEQFEETCEAFDLLGVHQDEQTKIFQVLAAILHLGNINIEEDDGRESTYIHVSMGGNCSGWDGDGCGDGGDGRSVWW